MTGSVADRAHQAEGARSPQPPVDYWLKLVDALINRRFAELLDEHGLTRRQWEMLRMLTAGPASPEVLDEALSPFLGRPSSPSSVDQLGELVDSGWVSPAGEEYGVTDFGQQCFDRISAAVERSDAAITAGLDPGDLDTTVAVLQQMARNLGSGPAGWSPTTAA
ncbi:MAG: hypothetical protein JWP61_557 [Friedmanniella sp.]|nr:hypothetical protein [Friedmanniella sp.]